jgi:hypothetical protein
VWAVRGFLLGVGVALATAGVAVATETWWMVGVAVALAVLGAVRILAAGEMRPVEVAAEVDRLVQHVLEDGGSTFTLEVEPTGALYVLTVPKYEYYALTDECPHCFVERHLVRWLPAPDGARAVDEYRAALGGGATRVATFRKVFGGGWFVLLERQPPFARQFRPVQCPVHGPGPTRGSRPGPQAP